MIPDLDFIIRSEMQKMGGRDALKTPNALIYVTRDWKSPLAPEFQPFPRDDSEYFYMSDVTMDYYGDPNTKPKPTNGTSTEVINTTSVEQTLTVVITHETTTVGEWTFSEGFKIGVKASGKLELPLVASGNLEVSTEFNFSAAQKHSESDKKGWTVNQPIKVPPQTRIVATLLVDEIDFTQKFHTRCTMGGTVRYEWAKSELFGKPVDVDYIEQDIADLFRRHPVKGFTIDGRTVHFEGEGECSGVVGLRSSITYKQYRVDDPKNAVSTQTVALPSI